MRFNSKEKHKTQEGTEETTAHMDNCLTSSFTIWKHCV
jgi:hypothetical protein